jgi:type IX secretion system PorP/SprF family membrane protein
MKNKTLLFIFFLTLSYFGTKAQDPFFTQWETMPLYFNPAMTGDFEGMMRFQAKYRNGHANILGENSFRTMAASAEYKFAQGEKRKLSLGYYSLLDKAGSLELRNNRHQLSAAVSQYLGDPQAAHHILSIGFNGGLGSRSINLKDAEWGGPPPTDLENYRNHFFDFSTGLLWRYRSLSHFTFQLGGSMHHIHQPNVSITRNGEEPLRIRYTLHSQAEVPLLNSLSLVPSFLLESQGPHLHSIIGVAGKLYFNPTSTNFIQLGARMLPVKNFDREISLHTWVLTATLELQSISVGFAWDRNNLFGRPIHGYEFSVGYVLGRG